mmetsp:Transcript_1280/g.2521  ORF Transcript_1280/g.2521 Transcript_1280/m.2521 type:complete len:563 (-) Transcript_1280:316-2004(-)|eukprot:CAMPEP_0114449590 /NCGR_PEP_ID=MMETSP0104-20121206/14_1 /TAXON_ID=37642 ORGANISM="Paraphysomonas imperforata, Strain PA2" /NCGR_SAMPLE_ID=MMETSP0104 /ASSEMBLY_ACC=CAM_ASM_000202 /LENGTH=562 /DNA_ID=CAMNT_0001621687 /DNA_START=27 /DNA_END=1715 /DNA_ORIENTATION=-
MSNYSVCETGVFDCNYAGIPESEIAACAPYNEEYIDMESDYWIVIVSAFIMSVMAFGIGSNDAANSWATSVGSGAITLKTALIMGAVFEFSGTVLLGSGVARTIKEDISDIENADCWACGYCDSKMSLFQAGMLASLVSTAVFLMLSSFTSMPVSATHAVVGSVAGMTIGAVGVECVDWTMSGMGALISSWVISPVLAGIIAVAVYAATKKLILDTPDPRAHIIPTIPWFMTFITLVMTFLVCIKSDAIKGLGLEYQLIITGVAGVLMLIAAYVWLMPWIKRNMPSVIHNQASKVNASIGDNDFENSDDEDMDGIVMRVASDGSLQSEERSLRRSKTNSEDSSLGSTLSGDTTGSDKSKHDPDTENGEKSKCMEITAEHVPRVYSERDDAMFCFRVLLVFNAALKSFAHGANDTANATGPFSAVLEIHDYGLDICADDNRTSPIWIMVIAGSFVALGIVVFGHRVITTVGEKLTIIDYHSGFCIELGSAVTVVLATELGIPVSTTHCQIGAVVGAGIMTSREGDSKVHWKLIGKIAATWVLTVPFSGLLSVALTELLRPGFK